MARHFLTIFDLSKTEIENILLSVNTAICSMPYISKSLYLIYKQIQDTVRSQYQLNFKLQLAFFPVMNYRYWQVDSAKVIPINACVTFL